MDDRSAPDAAEPGPYGRGHEPAGVSGGELTAVLHRAVHQTAHRLHAVTAAVYLLTGRMSLDSPYASARALASPEVGAPGGPRSVRRPPRHGASPVPTPSPLSRWRWTFPARKAAPADGGAAAVV